MAQHTRRLHPPVGTRSMFDLESAISQWRERLSWRDAFTDADLDEMESHHI